MSLVLISAYVGMRGECVKWNGFGSELFCLPVPQREEPTSGDEG